jgi:Co/Zn/Cd efflux system component
MALYLTGFFMFAEVGGGILTHGLALLSAAAASSDMLVVAIVGLVVNLISMRLLSAGK